MQHDPGHEQHEHDTEDEDRRPESEVVRLRVLDVDRLLPRLWSGQVGAASAGRAEGRVFGQVAAAVRAGLHVAVLSMGIAIANPGIVAG